MYEHDEDLKQKKNHNTLWIVILLILTLFIGLSLGYVFRENQAEEAATETIQQNQQDRQDAVDNLTPTEPSTPTAPTTPTEPTTPTAPSDQTPSTPTEATTNPEIPAPSN